MTRKDYELIADVVRNLNVAEDTRKEIAGGFASALVCDNLNFMPSRFLEACRPCEDEEAFADQCAANEQAEYDCE